MKRQRCKLIKNEKGQLVLTTALYEDGRLTNVFPEDALHWPLREEKRK